MPGGAAGPPRGAERRGLPGRRRRSAERSRARGRRRDYDGTAARGAGPRAGGLFGDPCWVARTTKEDGQTVTAKYKRVAAGIALPKLDQPQGAAVVLAEFYQMKLPPGFAALAARVGLWPELERGLGELRRGLSVETFVGEDEASLETLRCVPGLRWSRGDMPIAFVPAPENALEKIAEQRVDQLIHDRRLHLEAVQATLDPVSELAFRAVQYVVLWLLAVPASYGRGLRSIKSPRFSSTPEGEAPRPPFRRDEE